VKGARVLAVAGVLFGAMWLLAAGAKAMSPWLAYEFAARAVPEGVPTKPSLALVVAGEAFLGAAMCLRAVRSLAWSLAGLLAMTAMLVALTSAGPAELIQCGCFGPLFGTPTLAGAIVRNAVLIAAHVALMLWARRVEGAATPTS
jgi:hypothetical protein